MAIAGRIEYEISVDTSGLTKGLNDAKKKTSSFASTLGSLGRTGAKVLGGALVAGVATATGAVAGLASSAVNAYADFQQLKGGVEKIFGDSATAVMENAQEAFRTAGISANQYMEQATSFSMSLLQSLEGDTAETARITDMAIQDMADNANTFGSSIESIQNAYQGFAKQNYTMLDNLKLGYGGTKTEMERLLEDAEKLSGVHYDIGNLDDVFEAIHVIQEQAEITGTTLNEAQGTISGSITMMKASWTNLITGMADDSADFDKLIDDLVGSITAVGVQVAPRLATAFKGAVNAISALIPELAPMIPELIGQLLPAIIEATQVLLMSLVENLPMILEVLQGAIPMIMTAIYQITAGILEALPEILTFVLDIVLAVAQELVKPDNLKLLLNAGVELLWGLIEAIPVMLESLMMALPDILTSIIAFLLDPETMLKLTEAGVALFLALVSAVPQIFSALFQAFGNLFKTLWDKLQKIFSDFAGNFGEKIGGIFKNAINHVLAFIESFINAPINVINGFIDTINGAFGAIGVNIGKIGNVHLGRMATGGIVQATNGGQLILAGEGGQDEWVVPESKMADMIQKINEQGGTGGGVTINIQGVFATSDAEQRAVAEQIYEKLQELNKSRMGAYL